MRFAAIWKSAGCCFGWSRIFVIQDMNGNEFYTRNGQFGTNANGELVNQAGNLVSPGIAIPSDANYIQIDQDGTISAIYNSSPDPVVVGTIQVADFINPAGLRALGGNLYAATPESGAALYLDSMDDYSIRQGFVEGRKVDVAEELVNMITAQRAFDRRRRLLKVQIRPCRLYTP